VFKSPLRVSEKNMAAMCKKRFPRAYVRASTHDMFPTLQPELFDESPMKSAKSLASPFSMFAGSLSPLISNSPGIGKSPAGAGSLHDLKLYVEYLCAWRIRI
jgi:hypothetical protein